MNIYHENQFLKLPPELYDVIIWHADPASNKIFALVSRAMLQLSASSVRALTLCPPHKGIKRYSPEMPADILVELIKRYSHIIKFSISTNDRILGFNENKYISKLIEHLSQHHLSHIRKIEFREFVEGKKMYKSHNVKKLKELNCKFILLLGNSNLESISIRLSPCNSAFTGKALQPILEKSLKLKEFTLIGSIAVNPIQLSFRKQTELVYVNFSNFTGSVSIMRSLARNCSKIETLIQERKSCAAPYYIKEPNSEFDRREFQDASKKILTYDCRWKLKTLHLPEITIETDDELLAIVSKFPDLENLHLCFGHRITQTGLNLLWQYCPNLRKLNLCYSSLQDHEIDLITKNLPLLEELSFHCGNKINGKGIAAIRTNCPNIRVLKMSRISGLNKEAIDHLLSLQKLTSLSIPLYSISSTYKGGEYLIDKMSDRGVDIHWL